MDEATKLMVQTRVLEIVEEIKAYDFEIKQLHDRGIHLGKRRSDATNVLSKMLGRLEQTYVAVQADVHVKIYGACSAELADEARKSMALLYPKDE